MGKLIVTEFVSLDGVMEAPGGEPGYRHSAWTTLKELEWKGRGRQVKPRHQAS